MKRRAIAAYKDAVREAMGLVEALRNLGYDIAGWKHAQVTFENFDELAAKPHLTGLRANAAGARRELFKAEGELYEATLTSRPHRARAEVVHRQAMQQYEPTPQRQPSSPSTASFSPAQHEFAQKLKAKAKAAGRPGLLPGPRLPRSVQLFPVKPRISADSYDTSSWFGHTPPRPLGHWARVSSSTML